MEKKLKSINLKKKIIIWNLIMVMIFPFISTVVSSINNIEQIAYNEHNHNHIQAFTETDGEELTAGRYEDINLPSGKNNNSFGLAGMYNYFSNYITSIGAGEETLVTICTKKECGGEVVYEVSLYDRITSWGL